MRTLLSGFGVLAALVFIAASGAMNWVFLSGQGKTPLEAQILGAVSLATDAMKALAPFLIASAWRNRRWLQATIGGAVFTACLVFSLFSALGFAAGNRGAVTGSRETLNARLMAVSGELAEVEERLGRIGDVREVAAMERELAGLRLDGRWSSSRQCTDATMAKSREFCVDYLRLDGELGKASSDQLLRARRDELRRTSAQLRDAGAGQEADPQARLLSRLLALVVPGADTGVMQTLLMIMVAVLIEIGSAFGLYLATGHGATDKRQRGTTGAPVVNQIRETARIAARPPIMIEHNDRAHSETMAEPPTAVSPRRIEPKARVVDADAGEPERFRLKHARALLEGNNR